MKYIYLDNAGTTPMATKVIEKMTETMTNTFGNASAVNYYGRQARAILDNSRHVIAESINAKNDNEIVFTSGGTESDNTAIIQTAMARKNEGRHLITTAIEHEAVLKPMAYLEQEGFEVTYLPVDEYGQINLDDLKQAIRSDTILVSIMMGNNEVGSHLPIKEIGEIVAPTNAWLPCIFTYPRRLSGITDMRTCGGFPASTGSTAPGRRTMWWYRRSSPSGRTARRSVCWAERSPWARTFSSARWRAFLMRASVCEMSRSSGCCGRRRLSGWRGRHSPIPLRR